MAAPVVAVVTYPTTVDSFLAFSAYAVGGTIDTVAVEYANSGVQTEFFASGVLQGLFQGGASTVTGAGTLADPYLFSLRPNGGWPATRGSIHSIALHATGEEESAPAGLTYLLDFADFALTRSTPGFEPTADGWMRPYPPNTLRPHASYPHLYRFDPLAAHYCGDNVRGLANRLMTEASWAPQWTAVNCLPNWYANVGGLWTPISEWTPSGEQACECVVTANGTASLSHIAANGGGIGTARVTCSVYVKLAAGAVAPVNGVELEASTDSGTVLVTKVIAPTSEWVRYHVSIVPSGATPRVTIILRMPNATAGDRVMFALPQVVGDNASRNWFAPVAPHPYIALGSSRTTTDGDSLLIPAASVPSAIRGLGGAWGFTWIPPFDSTATSDVTFYSCGGLYHEALWTPQRDNSIWIRGRDPVSDAIPAVRSQALGFSAGDVIEVLISPTTGKISVSGCSGSGNGLGPTTWTGAYGGTATPFLWPAEDMIVGDRAATFGYLRGSHMGPGYVSEPYAVAAF